MVVMRRAHEVRDEAGVVGLRYFYEHRASTQARECSISGKSQKLMFKNVKAALKRKKFDTTF